MDRLRKVARLACQNGETLVEKQPQKRISRTDQGLLSTIVGAADRATSFWSLLLSKPA